MHEALIRSFDGTELYRCTDEAPGAALGSVLLLHGLGGHCRRFDAASAAMATAGWRVTRFDLRGHGRSGGARADVRDYRLLVKDVRLMADAALAERPGPLFTVGYSMGGLLSLLLGVERPEGISGQVLIGAPTLETRRYRNFRRPQVQRLLMRCSPSVGEDLLTPDEAARHEYERDPWVLHAFVNRLLVEVFVKGMDDLTAALPAHRLPFLALHGSEDRIVPPASAENLRVRSASPDGTLTILEGAWHDLLHGPERDRAMELILGWLKAHAAAEA